ncbi:MAG: sensor histidine kinase [Oscillibacter sp.]|nr:sensor histidine kinase [Oscillibacter sp.]
MRQREEIPNLAALMFVVNLSIVLFYAVVVFATTARICRSFEAYGFLSTVRQVPDKPWVMPSRSLISYGLLTLVSFAKYRGKLGGKYLSGFVCVAEIALCFATVASLNFYYTGVALLVLSDLTHYIQNPRVRLGFMIPLSLLFALGRYEIASVFVARVPFSAYLNYYSPSVRGYLAGIESVLVSWNVLLFVYDMILLFTSQREENARISRLNLQLKEANQRLRKNAVELEHLTETRERNRLAREIHDTLGHTLTGIVMGTEAVSAIFDAAPEEAKRRIEIVHKTAQEGLEDVRRSIKALRPDALEKRSLEKALEELITNFHLTTSVDIDYQQDAGALYFAGDEEDTLYRIIQEGMTNSVRHGHATEIEIQITREGNLLTVRIRDNGLGCAELEEGFGLRHMEERLGLLGGSLAYGNRNDDSDDEQRGFYLIASLPVRGREGKEHD